MKELKEKLGVAQQKGPHFPGEVCTDGSINVDLK